MFPFRRPQHLKPSKSFLFHPPFKTQDNLAKQVLMLQTQMAALQKQVAELQKQNEILMQDKQKTIMILD